ncbi:Fic/DOC family protein [compost metagenome]
MHKGEILMYQTPDGNTQLDVKLDDENVWINRQQMAELFDRDVKTIGKHINNALKEELNGLPTVANFATVQTEGNRKIERHIDYYNLDMIISVGYRVKSNRGIQFRIWANKILNEYLVKGYSLNESRLREQNKQLNSLKNTVNLLSNVLENKSLNTDEATGLLRVVSDYAYALDILDKYDHQQLTIEGTTAQELFAINYDEAKQAIHDLKDKFGGSSLFGNEIDLYPSVEEKAANLLYFVVKNHSFSDGNKRIAAYLFVWFLDKNSILYKPDGSKRIADNALVALTLMIAESKSDEKEIMVKVIVNLINIKN